MSSVPILGCIADDFTGASDMASFLVKGGLNAIQVNGQPINPTIPQGTDAVVVALKIRTEPVDHAVDEALKAIRWLKNQGCQIFYFKYCSTFDSTSEGNIGPIIDALLDELGLRQAIICPALPANGRTVYQGHLFVFDQLLEDSPLKDHPLTPMRDSNLTRLLSAQIAPKYQNEIGVLPLSNVVSQIMTQEQLQSRYLVTDCVEQDNLRLIAELLGDRDDILFTGGSGLGEYISVYFANRGHEFKEDHRRVFSCCSGKTLILAGSCSVATREQVANAKQFMPSLQLEPILINNGEMTVNSILDWLHSQTADTLLVYSSATPESVKQVQTEFGKDEIAQKIENLMAAVAVDSKIKNIVVAGGETSGAVVEAFNLTSFRVGPSVCPGVPLMQSTQSEGITLALKSGNFGSPNFFLEATSLIQSLGNNS